MSIFTTSTGAKLYYETAGDMTNDPLVLIHGQGMCGLDYRNVIDELSGRYAVYLVDCFGHGKSEKDPQLYRCNLIGDAIAELIEREISRPCLISGHSSGGILAAYIAGAKPELVKGVMLEDPPFFNAEPGEFENTFVYKDGFAVTHNFLQQDEEKEYLVYYLENGYVFNYLGSRFFGSGWTHALAQEAAAKLKDHPNTIPRLNKVPENSFRSFAYWDQFDLAFSESFYTGEWFEGVDQEDILKSVRCPVLYLKAKTKYAKDGVLWAATSDESADRIMQLLKNGKRKDVKSGHDIHYENPRHFLKGMKLLQKML